MEKIQTALERARESRSQYPTGPVTLAPAQRNAIDALGKGLIQVGDLDAIPRVHLSRQELVGRKIVTADDRNEVGQAFRLLRTHVLQRSDVLGGRLIALTSPQQGDGKTLVAINLAVTIARQLNRNAILIDADIRRPSVHRYLNIDTAGQTADLLRGTRSLAECLVRTDLDDLLVMPQKESSQRSSELLSSEAMMALGQVLRRAFPDRLIIIDLPPLLPSDDALALQRIVDGMLLVLREGRTTRADLKRAAELIDRDKFLGCVMNNARWQDPVSYY